jgi:hypothetical protein
VEIFLDPLESTSNYVFAFNIITIVTKDAFTESWIHYEQRQPLKFNAEINSIVRDSRASIGVGLQQQQRLQF